MSFFQSPFNPVNFALAEDKARNISSIDPKLSRTNYYDGRLLRASDLIRDQLYLDERLREVGRVLGQGIVRGLDVRLTDDGKLIVEPGLAIAPSGRILELEKETLEISLYDTAKLAELNSGFRYLERGLYAVMLEYAEKGEGSAEVYPRDLEGDRGFHFNSYAEGVALTLQSLSVNNIYASKSANARLQDSVVSRAALVREFILPHRNQRPELPENGIALGLLAVENGRPEWFDLGLLRRQYRPTQIRYNLQMDLFHHYQELLQDVLKLRQQSSRTGPFPAAYYFDLMPPFGAIPKECVDPAAGYQSYFPESFEVSIAPVRLDDIDAIVEQSKALELIDLRNDKDVDIIILVPLSDHEFAMRARQLQHVRVSEEHEMEFFHPQHLDDFPLSPYATHEENTDSSVWNSLWPQAQNIFYVRRPTRVAETQVSAIILAAGKYEELPKVDAELQPDPEGLESLIDELKDQNEELLLKLSLTPDERLKNAEDLIDDLEDEIARLEDELEAARDGDNNELKEKYEEVLSENESLKKKIEEVDKKIEELELNNQTTEKNLKDKFDQLETENKKLLKERSALEAKLKELEEGTKDPEMGNISFKDIVNLRSTDNAVAIKSIESLQSRIQKEPKTLSDISNTLLLMPAGYDDLNWPTVEELVDKNLVQDFTELMTKARQVEFPTLMIKFGTMLKLSDKIIAQWKKLAESE